MFDLAEIHTKEYDKRMNSLKGRPDWPCLVCGRKVADPEYYLHLCHGGQTVVLEPECSIHKDGHDGACLGLHAIGPDCAKKLLKDPKYAPYVHHIAPQSERFPPATEKEMIDMVDTIAEQGDGGDGFNAQYVPPKTNNK